MKRLHPWIGALVGTCALLASLGGVAAQGEESLAAAPLDPAARLPQGGGAAEHWDLTVRLDSGHWIVARFIITAIGPGDQNALVLGHVLAPGGNTIRFKNGRRQARWTLSEDRLALDVGTSHLWLRDPLYRLWIDKDAVRIDLRFAAESLPQPPADFLPAGYELDVLAMASPVTGTLELPGMKQPLAVRGRASLRHTVMARDERELVTRRIEFQNLELPALYGVNLTRPDGTRSHWLAVSKGPGESFGLGRFKVGLEGQLAGLERQGYRVPTRMVWSGDCVEGQIELARPLLENDPLSVLPYPIRWLASLRMKPHRVWAESPFDVTLSRCSDRSPVVIQGTGLTALTFLDTRERHGP